jgi:hypothetical protein
VTALADARTELTKAGFRLLNSVVEPAVKAGAGNPLPVGAGPVVLETVGWKSGRTRQVPLLATRLGRQLVVSTVRENSHWLKNVEQQPDVTVWLFGQPRTARAHVTRGCLNVVTLELTDE